MIYATTVYPKSEETYKQEQKFAEFIQKLRSNVRQEISVQLNKLKR